MSSKTRVQLPSRPPVILKEREVKKMVKQLITDISEEDFRRLNIVAYAYKKVTYSKCENALMIVSGVFLIGFCIWRNIIALS